MHVDSRICKRPKWLAHSNWRRGFHSITHHIEPYNFSHSFFYEWSVSSYHICVFDLKQQYLFIYLLTLYLFQNHSDGKLTSNKTNNFCFFPTLFPKCLFWEYVSLVSGYEILWKGQILTSKTCICTAIHCNYDSELH